MTHDVIPAKFSMSRLKRATRERMKIPPRPL